MSNSYTILTKTTLQRIARPFARASSIDEAKELVQDYYCRMSAKSGVLRWRPENLNTEQTFATVQNKSGPRVSFYLFDESITTH